jgi:predicted 3-demethylubiquinone-9 3-methyltransferase (glyoxalase superfamily)
MSTVTPFLMFEGSAGDALQLYSTVFTDCRIESISRYEEGEGGPPGTVRMASLTIGGQRLMCFDSPIAHGFTFTPSFSLYVECESEEEIDRVHAALSEEGTVMMPLAEYPFSPRYSWLSDRYGVSWQLTLRPGRG